MARKLFIIPLFVILLFGFPSTSRSATAIEIMKYDAQEITITVKASTIHVTGANGEMLHVYNVAGVRIMSIKVDGIDKYYELNLPKGCYIVKVGKTAKKIFIK